MTEARRALEAMLDAVRRAGNRTDTEAHSASAAWSGQIQWSTFAMLEDELETAISELEDES